MNRTSRGGNNSYKNQEHYNFASGGNFFGRGNKSSNSNRFNSSGGRGRKNSRDRDDNQINSPGLKNENRLAEFLTYGNANFVSNKRGGGNFYNLENRLDGRVDNRGNVEKSRGSAGSQGGNRGHFSQNEKRGSFNRSNSSGKGGRKSSAKSNEKPYRVNSGGTKAKKFDLAILAKIIEEKIAEAIINPGAKEYSYSAKLYHEGIERIAQKVGEEATEVVISAMHNYKSPNQDSRQQFIGEVADLFYHVILLLASQNVALSEVISELEKRNSLSTRPIPHLQNES